MRSVKSGLIINFLPSTLDIVKNWATALSQTPALVLDHSVFQNSKYSPCINSNLINFTADRDSLSVPPAGSSVRNSSTVFDNASMNSL